MPASKKYSAATLLLVLHFIPDDGGKLDLLKQINHKLHYGAPFIMLDITGDNQQFNKNIEILTSLIPDSIDSKEKQQRADRIKNELFHVSDERLKELLIEAGYHEPTKFYQSAIYKGWIALKK